MLGLELAEYQVCSILLVKANHRASPDFQTQEEETPQVHKKIEGGGLQALEDH